MCLKGIQFKSYRVKCLKKITFNRVDIMQPCAVQKIITFTNELQRALTAG